MVIAAVGRLRKGPEAAMVADYLDRFAKTGRSLGLPPITLHEVEDNRGGGMAAELLGIPWIELCPHPLYLPSRGLPPIGSGLGIRNPHAIALLRDAFNDALDRVRLDRVAAACESAAVPPVLRDTAAAIGEVAHRARLPGAMQGVEIEVGEDHALLARLGLGGDAVAGAVGQPHGQAFAPDALELGKRGVAGGQDQFRQGRLRRCGHEGG